MDTLLNFNTPSGQTANYANFMATKLGHPTHPWNPSILNPHGKDPDQLKRGLWASWEGKNDLFTRFFLENLTNRGDFIRKLLPVETTEGALNKYNLRVSGDKVEYDVWSCEPRVIADQSRRNMGRTTSSSRQNFAASFNGSGVGFVVPMDFLENETKMKEFGLQMKRMNESVVLTWTFRVLFAIIANGLSREARDIKKKGPLNEREFKRKLLSKTNRTFALSKNGSGFAGVEAHAVDICRMRSAYVDTVIIPAGATIAEHVERSYSRKYDKEGKYAYPENKNLDPEGNKTKFHKLDVYESRRFPMPDGPPVDPASSITTVSQRFLQLPGPMVDSLTGYRTYHRDIEIPDGDHNEWKRISMMDSLKHCGMWGSRSDGYPMTETGIKLLSACCDLGIDDHDDNQPPGGGRRSGGLRSRQSMSRGVAFPDRCTAYRLFKQADILNDVISIVCGFSADEAIRFRETLSPTDEDLEERRVDDRTAPGLGGKSMSARLRAAGSQRYAGLMMPSSSRQRAAARRPRAARPQVGGRRAAAGRHESANTANPIVNQVLDKLFSNRYAMRIRRRYDNLVDPQQGGHWILPVITPSEPNGRSPTILYTEQTPPRSAREASSDTYWRNLARVMNTPDNQLAGQDATSRAELSTKTALTTLFNELKRPNPDHNIFEPTENNNWNRIQALYDQQFERYTSAWSLIGRYSKMARFISDTPVTKNENLMIALNAIAATVLVRGAYPDSTFGTVGAFVMHCIDTDDAAHDMFVQLALGFIQRGNNVPQEPVANIEEIVAFVSANRGELSEFENEFMDSAGRPTGKRGRGNNGSGDIARASKRVDATFTRQSAIDLFKSTRPDYNFFNAVLRHNVPCPVAMILFRMHIRIASSAIVFMVRGAKTGVVAIKDGALMFTRSDNDFAIRVSTRFKSGVFIFEPKNIEVIPDAFPTAYIGGAGTRMYDPVSIEGDRKNYCNGVITKDIFAHLVPYTWTPSTTWTDISGKVNPAVYVGPEHSNGLQYPTCIIYRNLWGHAHSNQNVFVQERRAKATWKPTLALQSTQRVHSGAANTTELTRVITGHCAMGENCTPSDFKILQGSAAAFGGSGLESSVPRV